MALNPTSVPFFPSTFGAESDERSGAGSGLGFRMPVGAHGLQRTSSYNPSLSTSEFRSANSSPAGSLPTADSGDGAVQSLPGSGSPGSIYRGQQPTNEEERKATLSASSSSQPLQMLPEEHIDPIANIIKGALNGEETPGPRVIDQWMRSQAPIGTARDAIEPLGPFSNAAPELHGTPPILSMTGRAPALAAVAFNMPLKSSSPVSSIGSASFHTSSIDYSSASFEAQLKSSPFIRELMERLVRCELSNREIQRELADMHNKINLLVERALGPAQAEPEFKNPFAPSTSHSRSLTPAGNLAPFQLTPPASATPKIEDISQLSQRINTLTSSVGQLLALQTQQHINNVSLPQHLGAGLPPTSLDVAPNQTVLPGVNQAALFSHGLSNRPDLRPSPRAPNPPTRTWSAGNLDLPIRPLESNIGRPDNLLRDKRRSVTGLVRRDSAGVSIILSRYCVP